MNDPVAALSVNIHATFHQMPVFIGSERALRGGSDAVGVGDVLACGSVSDLIVLVRRCEGEVPGH